MTTLETKTSEETKSKVKTSSGLSLFVNKPNQITTISLFGNGKQVEEQIPEKYRNNDVKVKQYLHQRVNGYIKPGGK